MQDVAVTVLLRQLGTSADVVASTLRAAGIQGVPNAVRFLNPLVRYLQSRLTIDDYHLDVMLQDRVRLSKDDATAEEVVFIPAPVLQFLEAFNRGVYPDLQLPPGEGNVTAASSHSSGQL